MTVVGGVSDGSPKIQTPLGLLLQITPIAASSPQHFSMILRQFIKTWLASAQFRPRSVPPQWFLLATTLESALVFPTCVLSINANSFAFYIIPE